LIPNPATIIVGSPLESPSAPEELAVAVTSQQPPLAGLHPDSVLRAKVTHLEKELLRLMQENTLSRQVLQEHESLRVKYRDLQGNHDMLLQMYGELSEKL